MHLDDDPRRTGPDRENPVALAAALDHTGEPAGLGVLAAEAGRDPCMT